MFDALEQAKDSLKTAERIVQKNAHENLTKVPSDYAWSTEQCLQEAQAAAQIAIAERIDRLLAQQSVLFEYIVKRDQEFLKAGLVIQ